MSRRPRFVFGTEDFTLELPVAPWDFEENTIGGSAESGAKVITAFTVRRDLTLIIPLRFYESEWPLVRALIEFGVTGQPIDWYPDYTDTLTVYEVYLDNPAAGDDFEGTPDGVYPRALSLAIAVTRRGDAGHWDDLVPYFDGRGVE